jgi:uncharacterized DUF497 family protein
MDVVYVLGGVRFAWDYRKASANVRKHGVSFERAVEAFLDPLLRPQKPRVVDGEVREAIVGLTSDWRLLWVAYFDTGDLIRIISARPATAHERTAYEAP